MKERFKLIQKIVPEAAELFEQRLNILRLLNQSHTRLGRQTVAEATGLTERSVRTAIQVMREQDLLDVSYQGIALTEEGTHCIAMLEREILLPTYQELADEVANKLKIDGCIVVPGDVTQDQSVYRLMSEQVQWILNTYLTQLTNVIAVTGGSTLANIAQYFSNDFLPLDKEFVFVPTRGGLGGRTGIQSNSVVAMMASQTQSEYIPLFLPENLDETILRTLSNEPSVQQAINLSQQANCLIMSVGKADVMAERRYITPHQIEKLHVDEAVGEAFGVFYDQDGEVIVKYPRIGLKIEDLSKIELIINVVGGASKKKTLESFYKIAQVKGWLVCDEALAKSVLNEETH